MASKFFLKLDGIGGASTAPRHLGEIEIISFSLTAPTGGGLTAQENADPHIDLRHDLSFDKYADRVSRKLMEACADGRRFGRAVLTVEQLSEQGGLQASWAYVFEGCVVSSYRGGDAIENVGLTYDKMIEPAK